ncbi:MAG TPA: RibD family protein, partial [Bacteroidia bacterium]|nr:RibD family protein [Bacteroidia bacterium]
NRHFEVNQRENRPYVALKWSESADGFIAGWDRNGNPEPRAISGMQVNRHFHRLRHELQAILIGKNTALIDNPSLTTRHWPGRNPLRIVLDSNLELPANLRLFHGEQTVVINTIKDEQNENCRFWKVEDSHDLPALLRRIHTELKIGSILVEGGRDLLQQFIDIGLWDEIYRCKSFLLIEKGVSAPVLPANLTSKETAVLGTDHVEYFAC